MLLDLYFCLVNRCLSVCPFSFDLRFTDSDHLFIIFRLFLGIIGQVNNKQIVIDLYMLIMLNTMTATQKDGELNTIVLHTTISV